MNRRLWIILGIGVYLVFLWGFYKLRRARARRAGLSPQKLEPFDHRSFLDDLGEIYRAGLPKEEKPKATTFEPTFGGFDSLRSQLRSLPNWFVPGAWQGELEGLEEPLPRARDLLRSGEADRVDALVDPAQENAVDQQFASLAIHFFVLRLYSGDLDGASSLVAKLPLWTRERISTRTVDKHMAQIALLRVAQKPSDHTSRREASRRIRRAGGGSRYSDAGTLALWAHLSLAYCRTWLLEEISSLRVDYALRRALFDNRSSSLLYYELAHSCLWRGRPEEAADHLARALYFAGGDPFYARPILEWPQLARSKPSLVKQARDMTSAREGETAPSN